MAPVGRERRPFLESPGADRGDAGRQEHPERFAPFFELKKGDVITLRATDYKGAPKRVWMKGKDLFYRLVEDPRLEPDATGGDSLSALLEPFWGTKGPKAELSIRFGDYWGRDDILDPALRTMLQVFDRKGKFHSTGHPIDLVGVRRYPSPPEFWSPSPDPKLDHPDRSPQPGPFSLSSLSEAYGRGGYEQEREIYLRAVPNATDDQIDTALGVWHRLSEELGPRSLQDQARVVLAMPFVSQELVLAGGIGPETTKVTDRYPAVSLDEIRDFVGAASGQIRRGTTGIYSERFSAAQAREAIRDMKGASLAALERFHDEDPEEAAAYLEALRTSARQIKTKKATKAELGAVARLLAVPLPSDVDSWSQVKKARLKDLLEEHLEAEINPAAYARHGFVFPELAGAEWEPIPGLEAGKEYTLEGADWVHLINMHKASKRNRDQLKHWHGITTLASRWPTREGPGTVRAREYKWALAIADVPGYEARVYAFESMEAALQAAPEIMARIAVSPAAVKARQEDEELRRRVERRQRERREEKRRALHGGRGPDDPGGQMRLFNPRARLDVWPFGRLG